MEAFKLIADLGFSIAAVIGGGFFIIMLLKYILQSVVNSANTLKGMISFIYYIWKFVTTEILPVLGSTLTTLIALIDRIRMLDNDMIRLDQKIHTVMELQEEERKKKENEKQ